MEEARKNAQLVYSVYDEKMRMRNEKDIEKSEVVHASTFEIVPNFNKASISDHEVKITPVLPSYYKLTSS